MTKLVCPECRHENEPERIYCHECGARLDRSSVTKVAPPQETPEATRKRVQSMFSPGAVRIRHTFFTAAKVALGALVTAATIEMILPPDVPAAKKTVAMASQITLDLQNAVLTHSTAPLQYTDEQVNAYLAQIMKSKAASLSQTPKFERAVVVFDENVCRFSVERSLFGLSCYSTIMARVVPRNGTSAPQTVGGSIGRLPVHPRLLNACAFLFRDVSVALAREKETAAKMSAVTFHPHLVVVTP